MVPCDLTTCLSFISNETILLRIPLVDHFPFDLSISSDDLVKLPVIGGSGVLGNWPCRDVVESVACRRDLLGSSCATKLTIDLSLCL